MPNQWEIANNLTSSNETKICPFCAEVIRLAARKCRYCGEFLEGWTRTLVLQELVRHWDGRTRLVGIDLSNSELPGVILTNANLERSCLVGANLSGADLSRAQLHKADLRGANLQQADLWEVDLSAADLRGADLRQCSIEAADLSGANVAGANLATAQWRLLDESAVRRALVVADRYETGLPLSEEEEQLLERYRHNHTTLIKEISRANFTGAIYDAATVWPTDFDPQAAGAIEGV